MVSVPSSNDPTHTQTTERVPRKDLWGPRREKESREASPEDLGVGVWVGWPHSGQVDVHKGSVGRSEHPERTDGSDWTTRSCRR